MISNNLYFQKVILNTYLNIRYLHREPLRGGNILINLEIRYYVYFILRVNVPII